MPPKLPLNAAAWRGIAASGTAAWALITFSNYDFDSVDQRNTVDSTYFTAAHHEANSTSNAPKATASTLSGMLNTLSPYRTMMEERLPPKAGDITSSSQTVKTKVYDFVVIGNGNAGRSAVERLRELCPTASIAVVDPLRPVAKKHNADYFKSTVEGFEPDSRTVSFVNEPTRQLKYKYGLLVATGTRGAPPPAELFQDAALFKMLELRSTELHGSSQRPVLLPDKVREKILQAAKEGKKIGVLGSGWEALDLVAAASQAGKQRPIIAFGNPGPSWNVLPNYLSSALRKKIRKRGIDIQDRSIVRYIATTNPAVQKDKFEVHTARTYDLLETQRTVVDELVLAPDTRGSKGSAAVPTTQIPTRMEGTADARPWYKTWSQLTKRSLLEPSIVACFDDDGRIATSAELCAASRVYAAGSVAKYPNAGTGQASVAGEGLLDGSKAGIVAATNMSRDYRELGGETGADRNEAIRIQSFAATSLPIWRSDINTYAAGSRQKHVSTALSELGIQALCVGSCNSERQWTRAFWWTNTSAQRRLARMVQDEEAFDGKSKTKAMRRRNTRRRKRLGLVTPLYGIGCVFYLDHHGRIRGIMLWGLPFADSETNEVKEHLLQRLQYVLQTNGGVSGLDSEENYHVMNAFLAKESQRLVKLAVKGSTQENTSASHRLDGPVQGFSRPLYRYTEPKAPKNTTMNVLKRRENGHLGIMGEDLFALDQLAMEEEETQVNDADTTTSSDSSAGDAGNDEDAVSNLPTPMYPINVMPMHLQQQTQNTRVASASSLEELTRFMAIQRGWEDNDNRARPAKEDPLWLRPGDEKKNMSQKQIMVDHMRSLLFNRS